MFHLKTRLKPLNGAGSGHGAVCPTTIKALPGPRPIAAITTILGKMLESIQQLRMPDDRHHEKTVAAQSQSGSGPEVARACPTCGLGLAPSVSVCPQDGTVLGPALKDDESFRHKYEFLEQIGAGGMGIIYKARQLAIKRLVAIKVLQPGFSDEALRRFQTEATAASKLSHRYIITIHDMGTSSFGQPFIVMDYLEGRTLAQYIADNGPLKPATFLRFFLQICDALQQAHSRNVLHRDLKPSNIMIVRSDAGEEVRLMDFGIAKVLDDTATGAQQLTKTGEAIGSPLYMSPEQCKGAKLDARSDLYSLGCVMYESITAAPPFLGRTSLETMMMHLEQDPLPLSQASLGMEIDKGLEDIILRLLKKDPAQRYQSVNELETDLLKIRDSIVDGKSVRFVYQDAKQQEESQKAKRRKLSGWALIAVACVIVVGAVLSCLRYFATRPPDRGSMKLDTNVSLVQKYDNISVKELIKHRVAQRETDFDLENVLQDMYEWGQNFKESDLQPLEEATGVLVSVHLYGDRIDDAGLQYLKKLKLKNLKLDHTNVRKLSAISGMESLESLDVSHTLVDSDGLKVIGRLHNLRSLNLQGTAIDQSDAGQLYGLKNLTLLDLRDCNRLSTQALAQLQSALPKCGFPSSADTETQYSAADRSRLDEAARLREKHHWAEADEKYGSMLSDLDRAPIPNNPLIAHVLSLRAECQGELHQFDKLISTWQKVIELLGTSEENQLQLADALVQEAGAYEAKANGRPSAKGLNEFRQAIDHREQARKIFQERSIHTAHTWHNLYQLEEDYSSVGNSVRAAAVLGEAIAEIEKAGKTDAVDASFVHDIYSRRAVSLEALAAGTQHSKTESQNELRQAAAARESAWKIDSQTPTMGGRTADQSVLELITLANDYMLLKENAMAAKAFDKAAQRADKLLKSGSLPVATQAAIQGQRAAIFETKGTLTHDAQAQTDCLNQAIAAHIQYNRSIANLGKAGNGQLLGSLYALASDYLSVKDCQNAIATFDRALNLCEKTGQGRSVLAANVYHNRARADECAKKYAEGLRDLQTAYTIYASNKVGDNLDESKVNVLVRSARMQNFLHEPAQAEALLRRAFQFNSHDQGIVSMANEEMVKALTAQHKDAEAATYRAKVTDRSQQPKDAQ